MKSLIDYINEQEENNTENENIDLEAVKKSPIINDYLHMFSKGDDLQKFSITDLTDKTIDKYAQFLTKYLRDSRITSYRNLTDISSKSKEPVENLHSIEALIVSYVSIHYAQVMGKTPNEGEAHRISEENRKKYEEITNKVIEYTKSLRGKDERTILSNIRSSLSPIIQKSLSDKDKLTAHEKEQEAINKESEFQQKRIESSKAGFKGERVTGASPKETEQMNALKAKKKDGTITPAEERTLRVIEQKIKERDSAAPTTALGRAIRDNSKTGESKTANAIDNIAKKIKDKTIDSNQVKNLKARIEKSAIGRTVKGVKTNISNSSNEKTLDSTVLNIINNINKAQSSDNVKNIMIAGLTTINKSIQNIEGNITSNNANRSKYDTKGKIDINKSRILKDKAYQKIEDAINSHQNLTSTDKSDLLKILHSAEVNKDISKIETTSEIEAKKKETEQQEIDKDNELNQYSKAETEKDWAKRRSELAVEQENKEKNQERQNQEQLALRQKNQERQNQFALSQEQEKKDIATRKELNKSQQQKTPAPAPTPTPTPAPAASKGPEQPSITPEAVVSKVKEKIQEPVKKPTEEPETSNPTEDLSSLDIPTLSKYRTIAKKEGDTVGFKLYQDEINKRLANNRKSEAELNAKLNAPDTEASIDTEDIDNLQKELKSIANKIKSADGFYTKQMLINKKHEIERKISERKAEEAKNKLLEKQQKEKLSVSIKEEFYNPKNVLIEIMNQKN